MCFRFFLVGGAREWNIPFTPLFYEILSHYLHACIWPDSGCFQEVKLRPMFILFIINMTNAIGCFAPPIELLRSRAALIAGAQSLINAATNA